MGWEPLLAAALIPALVAAMLSWARRTAHRWWALGEALGLHPVGPEPRLRWLADDRAFRGQHGLWTVQLRLFHTGSGRNRETWTAVELLLPDADPAFTLRVGSEGVAAKLAKALGGEDLQVGDPDFDAAFRVRSSDPQRARRALDAMVRAGLAGLPRGEVRVGPALAMADGLAVPVGDTRHMVQVAKLVGALGDKTTSSLLRALTDRAASPDMAVAGFVRRGFVTDPAAARGAVEALARLAAAVTSAAPRPAATPAPGPPAA